ncbi:MAG: hypothetical protein ACRD2T_06275 [Thermoanaerobaculia bacterium]
MPSGRSIGSFPALGLAPLALFALLAAAPAFAADRYVCGETDLLFGCTKTEEAARLRAGCGVHTAGRFFASEWRTHDLRTDEVIAIVTTGADGIALLDIPQDPWFVIEGELACTDEAGGHAIPFRFLVERTSRSFRPHHYTPETLSATGNWNADTMLHYGAFRSRSLRGAPRKPAPRRPR